MIVMPANNSKIEVGYLAGKYPGRVGWLLGPNGWRSPKPWLPYAIDNGRFIATTQGKEWDEAAFRKILDAAGETVAPLWVVVPDVVGDRDGTLREWDAWAPLLVACGFRLAMAVQDGMSPSDVPKEAAVVFVGGTTTWKRRTLWRWCDEFPRVHVGRINTEKWLWVCHEAGAESCDGTGWFRGDDKQLAGLYRYLERSHAGRGKDDGAQRSLFEIDCGGGDSGGENTGGLFSADVVDAGKNAVEGIGGGMATSI